MTGLFNNVSTPYMVVRALKLEKAPLLTMFGWWFGRRDYDHPGGKLQEQHDEHSMFCILSKVGLVHSCSINREERSQAPCRIYSLACRVGPNNCMFSKGSRFEPLSNLVPDEKNPKASSRSMKKSYHHDGSRARVACDDSSGLEPSQNFYFKRESHVSVAGKAVIPSRQIHLHTQPLATAEYRILNDVCGSIGFPHIMKYQYCAASSRSWSICSRGCTPYCCAIQGYLPRTHLFRDIDHSWRLTDSTWLGIIYRKTKLSIVLMS